MTHRTRTAGLVSALTLLTVTGCFSLARPTPTLEQYVLGAAEVTRSDDVPGSLEDHAVGVRRIDLAPYLATPSIVVRRGEHGVVLSEFHRWGEEPAAGINRAVAVYLAAGRPLRAVDVAPWSAGSRYDHLIQLHVSRFEGVAPADSLATEGEARVTATWEIIRHEDETVVARGATDHREPGWRVGDYAALVGLLDRGLVALADDIAVDLVRLAGER